MRVFRIVIHKTYRKKTRLFLKYLKIEFIVTHTGNRRKNTWNEIECTLAWCCLIGWEIFIYAEVKWINIGFHCIIMVIWEIIHVFVVHDIHQKIMQENCCCCFPKPFCFARLFLNLILFWQKQPIFVIWHLTPYDLVNTSSNFPSRKTDEKWELWI